MRCCSLFVLTLLAALGLSGCGTSPGTAAGIESSGKGGVDAALRRVDVIAAVEKPIEQLVTVTGTLAAEQEIVLGMKVAGRISELPVDLGSAVQKGDVIARLDTTDFQLRVRQSEAALQQARVRLGLSPNGTNEDVDLEQIALVREARAQMDSARSRLDRATQLFEKGLMAKADLDTVTGAYKVTEAQYADALDEAQEPAGRSRAAASRNWRSRGSNSPTPCFTLRSTALIRAAPARMWVSTWRQAHPIVTLVQMSPLRLRTEVPERDALNIRVGMPVRVTVEGAGGEHQGRVARLSPVVRRSQPHAAGRNRSLQCRQRHFGRAPSRAPKSSPHPASAR